jgi:OmpA-OmpF porin, OOP family
MNPRKILLAILLASASSAALGNYVGSLKPPQSVLSPVAGPYAYGFGAPAIFARSSALGDNGYRFKLGYKANPYLSIETDFRDYGRASANPFANPASLSSAFRSTGFGVDAVATLPFWSKFSVYGRFGAFRGDARPTFAPYTTALMNDANRNVRMRYGLGMGYDITRAFGIRAEFDRFSPVAHPLPTDSESDQISVGVQWRF